MPNRTRLLEIVLISPKKFPLRTPDTEIGPLLCYKVIFLKNENFSVCVILGEKQLGLFFSSFFQKY